jgi:SAM-dependent methyltransferase
VVLFCEIIEHLQFDPFSTIKEIKRVLKPGGRMILTTPNVARLDNVFQIAAGKNINDRYSGYGPYGRHNREYTQAEIESLLQLMGFTVETGFTANVSFNHPLVLVRSFVVQLLTRVLFPWRSRDLGQYIFVRARNDHPQHGPRPAWLFRSFNPGD